MPQLPVLCQQFVQLNLALLHVFRPLPSPVRRRMQPVQARALTVRSTSSAIARSSSTCRSLSRRSRSICSYSRWRRSIVFWPASRLSFACFSARSSFSTALAYCMRTRCRVWSVRCLRRLEGLAHLRLADELALLAALLAQLVSQIRERLLGVFQQLHLFLDGLQLLVARAHILRATE